MDDDGRVVVELFESVAIEEKFLKHLPLALIVEINLCVDFGGVD